MNNNKQKLELTWIGKNNPEYDIANIEPRILEENPELSNTSNDPNTENMIIHGDNLLALKALLPEYEGKVKCIYIDPPYNTGHAFDSYDDSVEHSTWLSLMKPRLELLRILLNESGTIWITLDDNEGQYFKILCDEIFGRNNFIGTVLWNSRKSKQNDTHLSLSHNYNYIYAKDIQRMKMNRLPVNDDRFSNPDNDPRGDWAADPMDAPNIRPNLTYAIINPNTGVEHWPPQGRCWRTTEEKFLAALADNRVVWGKTGKSKPQLKRFKTEASEKGETPGTWWDDVGTATEAKQEIQKLFSKENLFSTPKPEKLIGRILQLGSNNDDVVLDSFLGSGTTAAVAHKMGRKYIGIEMGDHAYTHCKVRLDKVIEGTDQGGISKAVEWKGGGAYKFYELAPSFIVKDEFGNPVIDDFYNDAKLIKVMCKLLSYTFKPSQDTYWKQGVGQGKNYLYVTTQVLNIGMIEQIKTHLKPNETLVIASKKYEAGCENVDPRISIKKIPQAVLKACNFGKKEYLLPIKEESAMRELEDNNDEE